MRRLPVLTLLLFCLLSAAAKQVNKSFTIYDYTWYEGRPKDLTKDKISPIAVVYQRFLLKDTYRKGDFSLDTAKVARTVDAVKASGITTVSTDIEAWYKTLDGDLIYNGMNYVFEQFRKDIPGCNIGNYGIPTPNLNVYRYGRLKSGDTEEAIMNKWYKNYNASRRKAAEVADVMYPILYIIDPDMEIWTKQLEETVDYIKSNFPGKRIVAYIMPRYYDGWIRGERTEHFLEILDPGRWTRILEECYRRIDGVIVWDSGKYVTKNGIISWSDPGIQSLYKATLKFIKKHGKSIVTDIPDGPWTPLESENWFEVTTVRAKSAGKQSQDIFD